MAKYLSSRLREIKVGISSYTDNSTVVEVTGRVGIGTTLAPSELFVVGNAEITGVLTATRLVSKELVSEGDVITSGTVIADGGFFGDGSALGGLLSNELEEATGDAPRFVGFLTATSGTVKAFSADEGFIFIPSSKNVGLGTTTPDKRLTVIGDIKASGIITASEYFGDQVIGTPTGGFLPGAVGIDTSDYTKDSVNEINFILGKLVPKPPTTIQNAPFTLVGLTGVGRLCDGFSPTNNTSGELTTSAGTQYKRNISNSVTSSFITEYGPGDAGTVTGFINTVGVGTTTLSVENNNGTYGALQIANNKDAFFSSRNPGIASEFYQVYDARLLNAPVPTGFNRAFIQQNAFETQRDFWYQDPSTVSSPVLGASTPVTPPTPVLSFSSGVPHYTQSESNGFRYVIACENATGDMYSNITFLSSSGQTGGFQNGGSKSYVDFGGTNPPVRNFGVGIAVTCEVIQVPRDLHTTVSTDATKFSNYTASTPYGSSSTRATIPQSVNIMGTTARTNAIDEDNILVSSLGTGSGNAVRVNAGSSGDNPTPVFTTFDPTVTLDDYEAIVRGSVLRHDNTNYSIGFLPIGPDYSVSGRSSNFQYFQLQIIRSQVSEFRITVTGSYSGCWVSMPDNSNWTSSLSGVNGWADMFQAYRGAGIPTTAQPGCSSGGSMNGGSGNFTCVFGTESSSNDANNRILIRWRLSPGQSITAMSFSNT